jgi:hypothetical protein
MGNVARVALVGAMLLGVAGSAPVAADAGIPVRIRLLKGSRQGPPAMAPGLEDLQAQLSHTAYVRWEQVGESHSTMEPRRAASLSLPGGVQVLVTLVEVRKDAATFEIQVPSSRTQSRLTVTRDKRIVQQVTAEKGGEAYFVTVRPWG